MTRASRSVFLALGIISVLFGTLCREASAHPSYAMDCSGCHGYAPKVSTTPASGSTLLFGKMLVGSTKSASLTISDTTTVSTGGGGFSGTFPTASGSFALSGSSALTTSNGGYLVPPGVAARGEGVSSATSAYNFTPTARGTSTQNISFTPTSGFAYSGVTAPTSTITLSGQGVAPVISVDSSAVAAGNVRIGTASTASLTIKNVGDGNQAGAGLGNLTGAVASGSGGFSGAGGSFNLADSASQTFNFSFAPTTHGAVSAPLAINATDGSTDGKNTAQSLPAALTGTGVGPTLTSSISAGGTITFGAASHSQAWSISNTTTDSVLGALTNLDLISATVTGPNSQMFSLSGFTPGTILTMAQVDNLQVMFNPTAAASGTETAKLTLVTDEGAANGAAGKTISFSLSGLTADQAYWKGAYGGSWNSTAPGYNWTTGTGSTTQVSALPTATTDIFFAANGQATSNTTLGQDFSVKSVTFSGNAPSTTIGGSNTLTIGTGLSVGAGTASHAINANVQLGATQDWNIGSGSTLAVGGSVSGSAALSKDGAGTLVVSGTNTYNGGTSVTSGTLQVANALSLPVGHDLTITGAGSVVALSSGLTSAVKIGGLSIDAGSATPLASLDLANNELIVSSALESLTVIRGQILSAYSGGLWTGAGITSSTAAASGHGNTAIGFASNADSGMGLTSFGGVAVDPSSLLLRYTVLGDANLDGKVDIADFLLLRHNFGLTSNASWDQGDFDYDGKIDITDFMILRAHFGASLAATPAAAAQWMAVPAIAEFQAVPEPEPIELMIVAGLTLGAGRMARRFWRRTYVTAAMA